MKIDKKKVLVVASAGGHLTQAMSCMSLYPNIILVSNKLNIDGQNIKKKYKIKDTQHNAIIHFLNIFFAIYIFLKERPSAIFSTGGPIVLPFALLAKLFNIKFIYFDTLSRVVELSNTGKLIKKYRLYHSFYSQWEHVARSNNVNYIGKCIDILGENIKNTERFEDKSPQVLVTLGTNDYPFQRAIDLIKELCIYNDSRVNWVIQTGNTSIENPPINSKIIISTSRSEMEEYIKESSLVISHCGIGSINEMLRYQKKVFFIPRVEKYNEFSDDHQMQIANELIHPLFKVITPGDKLPLVSYDNLVSYGIAKTQVDTNNIKVARHILAEVS